MKAGRLGRADARMSALWYRFSMAEPTARTASPIDEAARERRLEMQHLHAIEGNPLTAEEIAMFEMFEREEWSEEREHAYIVELIRRRAEIKKTG